MQQTNYNLWLIHLSANISHCICVVWTLIFHLRNNSKQKSIAVTLAFNPKMSLKFGTEEVLHLLNASRTNKTKSTCIVRVAQRKASAVYPLKLWGCICDKLQNYCRKYSQKCESVAFCSSHFSGVFPAHNLQRSKTVKKY